MKKSKDRTAATNFLSMAQQLMEIGNLVDYQDIEKVRGFLSELIQVGGQTCDESIILGVELEEDVIRKLISGGVLSCVHGFLTVPHEYLTFETRNEK